MQHRVQPLRQIGRATAPGRGCRRRESWPCRARSAGRASPASVRNALAISSVVSPQTSRSVSAICASGGSAGWQHVKISRRRSSSTPSSLSFERLAGVVVESLGKLGERGVEPRAAANGVDRLEPPGRDEPRPRIVRHAVARPLLDGRGEGLVHAPLRPDRSRRAGEPAWQTRAASRCDRPRRPFRAHRRWHSSCAAPRDTWTDGDFSSTVGPSESDRGLRVSVKRMMIRDIS